MFDNPLRISGLASGMDIDQMVDKLMKAERIPLDQMKQQEQVLKWQRDDYRDMNKLLDDLDTSIFDGIFRQSTFLQKTVTSTNENAVSATAAGLKNNTTTRISVEQLAQASTGLSGDLGEIDPDAALDTQFSSGLGTQFTLHVFQSDGTIQSKDFTIDTSQDSLNDVLKKINDSGLGVTAFYDQYSHQISISTNHTGNNESGAEISVEETEGNLFTGALQFSSTDLADTGQNAKFTLNGLSTERTSNTFTINNITYTLKQETPAGSQVTISTATDVDAIYDQIQDFVDQYNDMIDKINSKLDEKRYRDYPPLTDEQRKEMSDNEIKLWEEKAKSGMLAGDDILSGGLNQMRMDLYSSVKGADPDIDQLTKIGIVTSSNYKDHGKLVIQDPMKLKQAIADNPNGVYQLFDKDGDTFEEKGLAQRLRDTISDTMDSIERKAGNSYSTNETFVIGRQIKSKEQDIDDLEQRLNDIQERYYRQFTAMEQAIEKANQQSAYLMNAFGPKN
jgi:flagellar hook-associated protein 2